MQALPGAYNASNADVEKFVVGPVPSGHDNSTQFKQVCVCVCGGGWVWVWVWVGVGVV